MRNRDGKPHMHVEGSERWEISLLQIHESIKYVSHFTWESGQKSNRERGSPPSLLCCA